MALSIAGIAIAVLLYLLHREVKRRKAAERKVFNLQNYEVASHRANLPDKDLDRVRCPLCKRNF